MLEEYNLHHMQKTECYLPFTPLLLHKAQSDQQKKKNRKSVGRNMQKPQERHKTLPISWINNLLEHIYLSSECHQYLIILFFTD